MVNVRHNRQAGTGSESLMWLDNNGDHNDNKVDHNDNNGDHNGEVQLCLAVVGISPSFWFALSNSK